MKESNYKSYDELPLFLSTKKGSRRSPAERVRFGKEEGANIVQFSPQGGNGTVLAPSDVLARLPGLEPGASGLGGSRSILLSYRRIRFMGAETAR